MDAKFFRPDAPEDDFQIRIDRNGQWYHRDSPISRAQLAKLFSTVLHRDPKTNDYWLITPHEQGRIEVEDVPYLVTDYQLDDQTLIFTTSLGHTVTADAEHTIYCHSETGLPYIHIDNNVSARLNRSVRDKLIHLALEQDGYDPDTGQLILTIDDIMHVIAKDVS